MRTHAVPRRSNLQPRGFTSAADGLTFSVEFCAQAASALSGLKDDRTPLGTPKVLHALESSTSNQSVRVCTTPAAGFADAQGQPALPGVCSILPLSSAAPRCTGAS